MYTEDKELKDAYNIVDEYPNKEISENSDIILRHLRRSNDIATWKPMIGRHINFMYNIFLNKLKKYKKEGYRTDEIETDKTDVLVSFTPCRSDYHGFVYPITNQLSKRGIRVSILLSHSRYEREVDETNQYDSEFNFFNNFGSISVIRNAKKEYTKHKQDILDLSEELSLKVQDEAKLCTFFQNYYIDKQIFLSVLNVYNPSVVYSLHFTSNPGYLGAIKEYKRSNELNLILIQHGAFSRSNFHDFNGADEAILWGDYFNDVITDIPYSDAVETTPIGNPKLQIKKEEFGNRKQNTRTILFASTPVDYNKTAIDLFLKSVENDWSLVFKPHPSVSDVDFKQYFEAGSVNPGNLISRESVYKLIRSADVVVGTESTVLLESVVLETPSIQLLPKEAQSDWSKFILSGSDPLDLNKKLKYALSSQKNKEDVLQSQKKYVRQIFGDTDNAAMKITDHIHYNYLRSF